MSFSLCDIHRCPLYGRFQEAQRTSAQRVIRSAEPVNLARLIDEVIGTAGQLAEKNQNRLIVEARGGCVIRFSHPYRDLDVECETHIGGPWNDWVRLKCEMTDYWTGEPLAIDDKIFLATSRPPFGGLRWWFVCPQLNRRMRKLYLPLGGRHFWSRRAYELAYASQRETKYDRALRRARKLRLRLGGDPADDEYPDKPPRREF
jgi:hypothetical protein